MLDLCAVQAARAATLGGVSWAICMPMNPQTGCNLQHKKRRSTSTGAGAGATSLKYALSVKTTLIHCCTLFGFLSTGFCVSVSGFHRAKYDLAVFFRGSNPSVSVRRVNNVASTHALRCLLLAGASPLLA
jgi:hypothetical protein